MGVTKKELADSLGVAKQTVVNYIDRLGLAPEHVTRKGKYDVLDDFAASAIANAVGKSIPAKLVKDGEETAIADTVVAALNDRIADLKEQNLRLSDELASLRASRDHEVEELRRQLEEANGRAASLADRVAGIAERQQAIAAVPWWRRGRMAMKLLGPGGGNE